jgi:hypothetical protein
MTYRSWVVFLLSLSLLSLFGTATPAAAQAGGGVKAGLALSQVSVDPDLPDGTLSRLNDFAAGGFFVLSDQPLTLQVDALVSRRGASVGGGLLDFVPGGFDLGDLVKLRATYLDISPLLRVQVGGGPARVYAFAGPTFGLKLEAEVSVPGLTQDIDELIEDVDLAVTGGIGVTAGHVLVEGRYNHGLRDIVPAADLFNLQLRHRSALLLVGIQF